MMKRRMIRVMRIMLMMILMIMMRRRLMVAALKVLVILRSVLSVELEKFRRRRYLARITDYAGLGLEVRLLIGVVVRVHQNLVLLASRALGRVAGVVDVNLPTEVAMGVALEFYNFLKMYL